MIINKLNLLLAERFIKASKFSRDTGIAQSTISKIVNNSTSQIDYSTLDKICRYLNITPSDFFEYDPINVIFQSFSKDTENEDDINKNFSFFIRYGNGTEIFRTIKYEVYVDIYAEELYVIVSPVMSSSEDTAFTKYIKNLSLGIQKALSDEIELFIKNRLIDALNLDKSYQFDINIELIYKSPL